MDITIKTTVKQHLAYEALKNTDIDEVFLGGGAGGGKTWFICESRLLNSLLYPGYRSFIARNELKRLMQSDMVTFNQVCSHHKVPQGTWTLNGQYNYIKFANGSQIDLLDVKYLPSDPYFERFGSTEYTDGAIEEAGEVHPLAKDVLKSRIGRYKNKELGLKATLLATGNPKKNWTYETYYKPWKEGKLPKNIAFIQSLYGDNPYIASDYGKQLAQLKDNVMKERLMYGNWDYDNDPSALIKYESIMDLFTNTITESEVKYIVADIARFGDDRTVITLWKGLKLIQVNTYTKQDLKTTATIIKDLASDEKVPFSQILIDEDGVGGGVLDMLQGARGFMGNSKPIGSMPSLVGTKSFYAFAANRPDNFTNLKSQCCFKLADYINQHKIRIENMNESDKTLLVEELEQIKRKNMDKEGKIAIEGKDHVKEVLGRSPDISDTLMMRMFFEFREEGPISAAEMARRYYIKQNNTRNNVE